MKRYILTHLVRGEHLNHHGNLYAGQAIEWMVEAAFVTATSEYGESSILFKNAHKFDFSKSVLPGAIIRYEGTIVRAGKSSLTIRVGVYNQLTGEMHAEGFATLIVVYEETARPIAHGIVMDEAIDEEEASWRKEAESYFR